MSQTQSFKYVKLGGLKLSPEQFGGKEPRINDVYNHVVSGSVKVDVKDLVPVGLVDGVHWLSRETYDYAKKVLATSPYEAHEGVTLTSAKGAWVIIKEPVSVEPPIGAPKNERYVRVETELSRRCGVGPFVVEERFVFRGFKGEDIEVGKVKTYRYFLVAYKRNGTPLTREELEQTLLWKNYLSHPNVIEVLGGVSAFMKKELWHIERMNVYAIAQYKVVWRDVEKEFIPAIEVSGALPDYTVNYVPVSNINEGFYLLALLLAPQINAVVRELAPWIGHVQPRFIKYFRIPKYNPNNDVHKRLVEIGKVIHNEGKDALKRVLKEIEELVEKL
jgi:hypothetical protein